MDIVFHSILVLFTTMERSWFRPLIELKATWVKSTYEGKPELLKKTQTIFKSIIMLMNRFIRSLCAD